jgi:hypothetical protein
VSCELAPLLPCCITCHSAGKNWVASEAAHEARVAVELGLRPGMKVLDCGCGVGGPMRTVASVSGAHVTGEKSSASSEATSLGFGCNCCSAGGVGGPKRTVASVSGAHVTGEVDGAISKSMMMLR